MEMNGRSFISGLFAKGMGGERDFPVPRLCGSLWRVEMIIYSWLSFFFSVLTFVLVFSLPLPLGAGSFGIKIRVEEGQIFFVFCERWRREWMEIYSWTPFSFWILTTSREIFLRFRFFFLFCVTKKGGVLTNEGRHWIGLVARLECGWEGDYRSLSLVSLTYRDRYDLYDSKRGIS